MCKSHGVIYIPHCTGAFNRSRLCGIFCFSAVTAKWFPVPKLAVTSAWFLCLLRTKRQTTPRENGNRTFHPDGHCWDQYHGALSLNQAPQFIGRKGIRKFHRFRQFIAPSCAKHASDTTILCVIVQGCVNLIKSSWLNILQNVNLRWSCFTMGFANPRVYHIHDDTTHT